MLLVKTKIGTSKIAGIGLFADQFISKGMPVWKLMSGFDIEIAKNDLLKIPELARQQFLNYAYLNSKKGVYILCFDDARFFNHSENPNVTSQQDDDIVDIAIRDINIGEELTQNYSNFDGTFGDREILET
jgi:uncharacterized protein